MTTREQIDYHLQQMAMINCNLGLDSTTEQRESSRKEINAHLAEIYKLDPKFFEVIKPDEVK